MLFRSDRKSTRLNSSHTIISYAVYCLKKKRAVVENGHREEAGEVPGVALSLVLAPRRRHSAPGPRAPATCLRTFTALCFVFFLMIRGPPRLTLFPYTTLFR